MARRVGRPSTPYVETRYTGDELKTILEALKKTSATELTTKVRNDIKARNLLHKNYKKAIARIFDKHDS